MSRSSDNTRGRFGVVNGHAVVVADGRYFDCAQASGGSIPSDPMAALRQWPEVAALIEQGAFGGGVALDAARLTAPVPDPGAIYGISSNFPAFVETKPAVPNVFMKSPCSVTGPFDDIALPGFPNYAQVSPFVTWEAELGVVIGRRAHAIEQADAFDVIAGVLVAQDLTERRIQNAPGSKNPEFVAAKSYPGFCPIGPWITPLAAISDTGGLRVQCSRNGETLQDALISDLVFSIAEAVTFVASICIIRPGDLLLMGTPPTLDGTDSRPLSPGDVLTTEVSDLGMIRNAIR